MVIFPIVAILWYIAGGRWALYGMIGLGLWFVLAAGFDKQAGLRDLHLTASVVQWSFCILGLSALIFFGIRQRKACISLLKASAFLILCISVPMLPWIVKNYSESRSFSITGLTQGKKPRPVITLEGLRKLVPPTQKGGE